MSEQKRETNRYVDISGYAPGNRPKAHMMLRYYEQYSDGSTRDIQVISIDKPIVSVFKHPGFVNVLLDFHQRTDMDLRMVWAMLSEYSNPVNSVDYLPEELESGYYDDNGEKKMVFFPLIELILSPIGRENEYQMHGVNPAFFTLSSKSPVDIEPCVLQLTFPESWFVVDEDLGHIDLNEMKRDIMNELASEMAPY